MYMYMCTYVQHNTFHPLKMLLQVSNTNESCVGEIDSVIVLVVCAGMRPLKWMACIMCILSVCSRTICIL